MLFQGADSLHQGSLEVVADAHDLAGGFHLGRQGPFCADKFVERQAGDLYHAVIQHGLKTGIRLPSDGVGNFIQCVAQGNLGRHLGDGVTGGFGSQGRGTAHPGIYLNHTILKTLRMEGILHVAAAGNPQLADDIQRGSPQHLVLLVPQSLGRSHHDTVPGMHAHRIDIFHIAYGDTVACAVPHNLILDFLPTRDTTFHEYLSHPGETQSVLQDLLHLLGIPGNTAAAAAQRVSRTQYHRVADLCRKSQAVFHVFHHQGSRHRLVDLLHRTLKLQPVLRLANGLGGRTDEANPLLL